MRVSPREAQLRRFLQTAGWAVSREHCCLPQAYVPGGFHFDQLDEEQALNHFDARPHGADGSSANGGEVTLGHDLRFWRTTTRANWRSHLFPRMKLAFLPVIAAAVLFSWQGFINRVQYFDAVATSHSVPIAVTIEKFVRRTFSFAQASPPSAYDAEMQMSANTLLNRWNPLIEAASRRFAVPEAWIRTVMRMESGGRTMSSQTQPITSHAGAMGLMQVMPGTYREMRAQYGLGDNAYDPHDNVLAGAAYLRWLHARYGYPAMFAVYNDGPGHFEQRLQQGETLPAETQNYVSRITATLGGGETAGALRGSLVNFTRPNGERVSIDPSAVASVRAALPGEYAPGVNAVVTVGEESQGVRESVTEVEAALNMHGGILRMARKSAPRRFRLAMFTHRKRISVTFQG
jgi:soluble lytic murein transglycosylase-like protein